MSSKDTLTEAGSILTRAVGTLSVLGGVAPDLPGVAEVEIDAYRDAVTALETKAKALEEHLSAVFTLLPLVRQETQHLKVRNKSAFTVLQKMIHGRRIGPPHSSKSKPLPAVPTEVELVSSNTLSNSNTPSKVTRRKSQSKTSLV